MTNNFFLYFIFAFLIIQNSNAQDDMNFVWQKHDSQSLGSDEVWTVDGLSNFYFSENGVLNKIDVNGVFKFSQSIKSLGKTKQIEAINTMKLMQFSDEQQQICYFDNTLTTLGDCLELSEYNIVYGAKIATSNQPDKVWVLDNLNSKLILLSLQVKNQGQEIANLNGVLQINNITQIIERNNRLYLLDSKKGVYIFDLYGSLIEFKEEEGINYIDVHDNSLFMLAENEFKIVMMNSGDKLEIKLPEENVDEFSFKNQMFYLRTNTHVHKYSLQFTE